jgi:hypothetical protein
MARRVVFFALALLVASAAAAGGECLRALLARVVPWGVRAGGAAQRGSRTAENSFARARFAQTRASSI